MYSRLFTMATIRLTVLNSIKENDGRLPILVCISQKGKRAYIRTEFLINNIAEFDNGIKHVRKADTLYNRVYLYLARYILCLLGGDVFSNRTRKGLSLKTWGN